MREGFNYEIIQIATEELYGQKDVVTEIRFLHTLGELKRLYVAHLLYENDEPYITRTMVEKDGKNILFSYIENSLGLDQIEHMENLLLEESKNLENPVSAKQYFDV